MKTDKEKIIEILKEEIGDRFDLSWATAVANRLCIKLSLTQQDEPITEESKDVENFESELTLQLSQLPYEKHADDGLYNDGQIDGFELGARWAMEKYNK